MTEPTFKHKFFGWLEADAYRYVNSDRSEGAIVAVTATVAKGLRLAASIQIGPRASIGDDASIGPRASIGYGASIGGGASIGYGEWWMTVGPQGSRNTSLTVVQKLDGLRWWVGCKANITTEELRKLVAETHGDSNHASDYLHVIAFVEGHPGRQRAWREDPEAVK